jgi:hypothetical protein
VPKVKTKAIDRKSGTKRPDPFACRACMSLPCQCARDAAEAKAILDAKAAIESIAAKRKANPLPMVKTVTLVHADKRQYDFAPQPGDEVLITFLGHKRIERYIVPTMEARTLYRELRKKGFKKW